MKETPGQVPNRNGLRYSAADKLKAMKLYLEEGYQVKAIVWELGIGKSSLGKWIREYREKGSAAFLSVAEKSAAEAEKSDPSRAFVRAQIPEHKAAHPDHGMKRITQIFRRSLTAQEICKTVLSVWTEKTSVSAVSRRYSVRPPQEERWELLVLEGMLKALEARPRGCKGLEMKENSLSSHLEKLHHCHSGFPAGGTRKKETDELPVIQAISHEKRRNRSIPLKRFNLFPLRTPSGSGAASLGTTGKAPDCHDGR